MTKFKPGSLIVENYRLSDGKTETYLYFVLKVSKSSVNMCPKSYLLYRLGKKYFVWDSCEYVDRFHDQLADLSSKGED